MKSIILNQPKKQQQQINFEFSRADEATAELEIIQNIVELTKDDFPELKIDPKEVISKN